MRPLIVLALAGAVWAQEAKPVRVLLLTGANNHDHEYTSRVHAETLTASGRFLVTVTNKPAETLGTADLAAYRCFVVDYNGPRWGEPAETRFASAVKRGTGVVIVHAANNAFEGWTEYEQMIVLGWRKKAGHGVFHPFDVAVADRNHPITAGLPPLKQHPDELYHGLTLLHDDDEDHRVLLTALSTKKSKGSGKVEPMALVTRFGKGRVFHTTLGHVWRNVAPTRRSINDPQFKVLLARGTEWAATGAVTVKPSAFGLEDAKAAQRPLDAWVYRCVLDKRARTVVVALDAHLYVAYDAATCAPFKAWGGSLELLGSVHDQSHGPQPLSGGLPYFEAKSTAWRLLPGDGTARRVAPKWLGYRFEKGQVVLRYRFGEIVVEERPEHIEAARPVLERVYRVTGLAEGAQLELSAAGTYLIGPGETRHVTRFALTEDPR